MPDDLRPPTTPTTSWVDAAAPQAAWSGAMAPHPAFSPAVAPLPPVGPVGRVRGGGTRTADDS